jgi:hypothetical protein
LEEGIGGPVDGRWREGMRLNEGEKGADASGRKRKGMGMLKGREREEEGGEANLEDAKEVFRGAAELSRKMRVSTTRRRGGRTRRRTLPQATLALSEYSEMATFSSTRWSAKLSGLSKRAASVLREEWERGERRTRGPSLRRKRRLSACRESSGGNHASGQAWRRKRGL